VLETRRDENGTNFVEAARAVGYVAKNAQVPCGKTSLHRSKQSETHWRSFCSTCWPIRLREPLIWGLRALPHVIRAYPLM